MLAILALTMPVRAGDAAEPLAVEEIAPGVFVHEGAVDLFTPSNAGDISNAGFIVGAEAVAVIDTGGSAVTGARLAAAIRQRTHVPVRYVINTHMHPDHVFGNAAFAGEGVRFIGHGKLARALAARAEQYLSANAALLGADAFAGVRVIAPDLGVDGVMEIDLGGRVLELRSWPTAHTDNDLTVFDRATKTLFLGDLLFADHVPALDGSIRGWLEVMDRLGALAADRAVPGHGPAAMAWPAALEPQRRYLATLVAEIRPMIAEGRTLAEAARSVGQGERGRWALFDDFNARNVSAAFAELEWE